MLFTKSEGVRQQVHTNHKFLTKLQASRSYHLRGRKKIEKSIKLKFFKKVVENIKS